VFKLRKGAGSENVRLARNSKEAWALAQQAFSAGFRSVPNYWNDAGKRYRATRRRQDLLGALKRLPSTVKNIRRLNQSIGPEKGYVYFQDFVADNQFDTRVTVIGERAFGFIRNVRPGDFRASGSGDIDYDPRKVDLRCVKIALETTQKMGSQSAAFDFVQTLDKQPLIVEVSYCYGAEFVHKCPGHWDSQLNWRDGQTWPEDAILVDLLKTITERRPRLSIAASAN
jgi:hypothetical protein